MDFLTPLFSIIKGAADLFSLKKNLSTIKEQKDTQDIQNILGVNQHSKRFILCLKMMNKGFGSDEMYSTPKLSSIMGHVDSEELDNYFSGKKTPPFIYLDEFSQEFGINNKWLKFGDSTPYTSLNEIDINEYYKFIVDKDPEKIYFIKSDSSICEAVILLKFKNWRYLCLSNIFHVSSHVGGTGSKHLYLLYELIKKLKSNDKFKHDCLGYILNKDIFNKLTMGNIFPGYATKSGMFSHWFDDYTDLELKNGMAQKYTEWYGIEFTNAQKIVRSIVTNIHNAK